MSASLRTMLKEAVTHEPYVQQSDAYGTDETYGAATSMRARIQRAPRLIRDSEGRETVSAFSVLLDSGVVTVGPKDRFTFADGTQPPLLSIRQFKDDRQRSLYKLEFGDGR